MRTKLIYAIAGIGTMFLLHRLFKPQQETDDSFMYFKPSSEQVNPFMSTFTKLPEMDDKTVECGLIDCLLNRGISREIIMKVKIYNGNAGLAELLTTVARSDLPSTT